MTSLVSSFAAHDPSQLYGASAINLRHSMYGVNSFTSLLSCMRLCASKFISRFSTRFKSQRKRKAKNGGRYEENRMAGNRFGVFDWYRSGRGDRGFVRASIGRKNA